MDLNLFSIYFLRFLDDEEVRFTSYAEWRYNDNPDISIMLLMGPIDAELIQLINYMN